MPGLQIPTVQALFFLPVVGPICFYVAFTDLREMRITNRAVVALAAIFVVLGPFVMPLPDYGWRLVQMVVALLIGFLLSAGGAMGAGDAKFIAAAAPFIDIGDLPFVIKLLAAVLLGAVVAHRVIRRTALRRLAPHWQSWTMKRDFPMGLALGGTLAIYLILGALNGTRAPMAPYPKYSDFRLPVVIHTSTNRVLRCPIESACSSSTAWLAGADRPGPGQQVRQG